MEDKKNQNGRQTKFKIKDNQKSKWKTTKKFKIEDDQKNQKEKIIT